MGCYCSLTLHLGDRHSSPDDDLFSPASISAQDIRRGQEILDNTPPELLQMAMTSAAMIQHQYSEAMKEVQRNPPPPLAIPIPVSQTRLGQNRTRAWHRWRMGRRHAYDGGGGGGGSGGGGELPLDN